jgi:hypothetical protein
MQDVLAMPIGSKIMENEGNVNRMTTLCRYGWTVIRGFGGGLVEMRRDFHRLYSRDELFAQTAPATLTGRAANSEWLLGLLIFVGVVALLNRD